MAKIMVISGGKWQCPIIKLAKSKGHFVLCTNLYEDSPAFEFSDVGLVANVLDKDRNLQIAEECQPDAIVTDQSDLAVPTVAYVAEKMGLAGIGTDVAERFTNKYKMREITAREGFPSPKFKLCHSLEEAMDFVKVVSPSIIKPLDSQSSRGVHIVENTEDIEKHWNDCIQYSNSEEAIVIEEYIDGVEFTVDGLKTHDDYIVTAISQKEHYVYNPSVANRLLFSNTNNQYDYEQLRKINSSMVEAMQLPFGITHAEYKYKDGNFYLIEIAARGGGTRISSDIVPLVSGINSENILLDILLGQNSPIEEKEHYECAVLGFFDFSPGKIVNIIGVEEGLKQEGVHAVEIEVSVGEQIVNAQDDRSRCGYYIIYADSIEQLEEREKRLKNTVKVVTE